ncbi:hypothetical protein GCM10009727_54520 [Actinomadura napierensis]|uniref:Transposase n=1 Tax=Actinomadura napierensis TaxID=267854 RepID=A0ABN2ZYP3_9ACTN
MILEGSCRLVPPVTDVLLFSVLRGCLDEADAPDDWAAAPAYTGISRALRAVHGESGRRWTVEALGRRLRLPGAGVGSVCWAAATAVPGFVGPLGRRGRGRVRFSPGNDLGMPDLGLDIFRVNA